MVVIGILLLVVIGLLVWYFFIRDSGADESILVPLLIPIASFRRDVCDLVFARLAHLDESPTRRG